MEIQAEQPQRRPAVDFGLGVEKVMETLAEGDTAAANALQSVFLIKGADILNTCLDLIDMEMRGDQITAAWEYCGEDVGKFVRMCAGRFPDLVAAVNTRVQDRTARTHGEQRRMTPTDFAVQSALAAAGQTAPVARMDENAEAIHEFFITMLKTMHATHTYETNFRLNTGLEGGVQAVFSIRMVEFLDQDGKPWMPTPPPSDLANTAADEETPAEPAT